MSDAAQLLCCTVDDDSPAIVRRRSSKDSIDRDFIICPLCYLLYVLLTTCLSIILVVSRELLFLTLTYSSILLLLHLQVQDAPANFPNSCNAPA